MYLFDVYSMKQEAVLGLLRILMIVIMYNFKSLGVATGVPLVAGVVGVALVRMVVRFGRRIVHETINTKTSNIAPFKVRPLGEF